MNTDEYIKLNDVEMNHWFYKGKRDIVCAWINKIQPLKKDSVLLDVGAGTGLFVHYMRNFCKSFGVEPSLTAISCAQEKKQDASLLIGSIHPLPILSESVDVVTSMDVLEHISDDRKAISELIRVTKKNGLIVITVPACSWAMSDWDVSLGHFRRYDLKDLTPLVAGLPVEVLEKRYINSIFFWPIFIYRWLRKTLKLKNNSRLEDVIPPPFINKTLYTLFVKPALWKKTRFPFGLSLLFILKKI